MLPTTSQSEIFRKNPIPQKTFCEKYFCCCKKNKIGTTHVRNPTAYEMEEEIERDRVVSEFARNKIEGKK